MTAVSIVVKHCDTVGVLTDTIYFCANLHSEGPSQNLPHLYPPACSEAAFWITPLLHNPGEILTHLLPILITYSFTMIFQEDKGPCDRGSVEGACEGIWEPFKYIQRTKDLQLFVRQDFVMGSSLLGKCLCRCMFGRKTASLSGNAVSKAFLNFDRASFTPVCGAKPENCSNVKRAKKKREDTKKQCADVESIIY